MAGPLAGSGIPNTEAMITQINQYILNSTQTVQFPSQSYNHQLYPHSPNVLLWVPTYQGMEKMETSAADEESRKRRHSDDDQYSKTS